MVHDFHELIAQHEKLANAFDTDIDDFVAIA